MRIALVHNVGAGEGIYETNDLARLFRDAGYEVVAIVNETSEIARAIETGADVLAVAGGDGTVAKAAIALCDRNSKVPLLILPVGTSNNIARALRIHATIPAIIKGLGSAQPVQLDIGRVSAKSGTAPFVEAAGVGFIGTMLHEEHSLRTRLERFVRNLPPSRAGHFEMAARGVARLIRRQPARHHDVVADGENLSGEYLAVEAMNIPTIGPRIHLAPHALPGDGLLDLLLVHPEDRAALADHVASFGSHRDLPPAMFRRVRRVEISWPTNAGHVDDEPWPRLRGADAGQHGVRVQIGLRGAVNILLAQAGVGRS